MKQKIILPILLITFLIAGFIILDPPIKPKKLKSDHVLTIHTKFGDMKFVLYDSTPLHKQNMIKLVEENFYDSTTFHRVIKNFMIQGGDPNSKDSNPSNDGLGGPGYTIPAEFIPNIIHKKGAIAAARQGDGVNPKKESSGSQFYIVQGKPTPESELQKMSEYRESMKMKNANVISYSEEQKKIYSDLGGTPHLDGEYTVFGEIISGINIIDSIANVKTAGSRPNENIYIKMTLEKVKRKKITKLYNYNYPTQP